MTGRPRWPVTASRTPGPGARSGGARRRNQAAGTTADIHFQPKYVNAAIDAGCAAVRVNPGNIRQFDDQVKQIAKAAGDTGVSIRIGVTAGSLDKRLLAKYGKATPEALVESVVWEASLFEEHGFTTSRSRQAQRGTGSSRPGPEGRG